MSIFNFKKEGSKIYELDNFIGKGSECGFYRIKGKEKLGVKIFINSERISSVEEEIVEFEKEIYISNIFRKNKIPVPRIVGIIDLYSKDKTNVIKGLAMEIIGDEILLKEGIDVFFFYSVNKNVLVEEIQLGDSIKSIINPNEVKSAICETVNLVINNLKISKQELLDNFDLLDFQGLYSRKTKKFYLIDLVDWEMISVIRRTLEAREK